MRRMSDLNCITMRLLEGLSLRTGLGHKTLFLEGAVSLTGCEGHWVHHTH